MRRELLCVERRVRTGVRIMCREIQDHPQQRAATRNIRRIPLQNVPVTEDPWTLYSPGDDVWLGREGDTR